MTTTMRTVSQARARMMQSQLAQVPKKTLIRYTREELLSLRDSSLAKSLPKEEKDQLFSVENLLKFANKPIVEPVEPVIILPKSLEPIEEDRVTPNPTPVQTTGAKTTKSYLSFAKPLAKNSPELASKLKNLIDSDGHQLSSTGNNQEQSNVEHSINIPIVINAGPLGQFNLNACAKLSIKINLDIEGLQKSQHLADAEERKAFIRQHIQMDTSDCQLTIQ